jgi:hypothetical protein
MKRIEYSLCVNGRVSNTKHFKRVNQYAVFFFSILLTLFAGCVPYPRAVYDFDDGTTQGWTVTGAVADDKGNAYTPGLFTASHFEAAQYPNSFPGGDPLNDKKGCLLINGYQMGPWAEQSNFPSSSEYWATSAHYSGLDAHGSTVWQGIQGVKASVGDNYGATPGHVTVNIGVRARIGGQDEVIRELDASGNPLFHPVNHQTTGMWSNLNAKLNIPANAEVYLVFIEIRGDWKNYHTYEGSIMIDQVEPIK